MAKVAFSKLGTTKETGITEIEHNEQKIEVKKYLPVEEKLILISNILNQSYDGENNFANPIKVTVFAAINIIEKYTNITFTEKQKEDPGALYDKLIGSDLYTEICMAIPKEELNYLMNSLWDTIEAFYKYRTSALGFIKIMAEDYKDLGEGAEDIYAKLADPENLKTVKSILTTLG